MSTGFQLRLSEGEINIPTCVIHFISFTCFINRNGVWFARSRTHHNDVEHLTTILLGCCHRRSLKKTEICFLRIGFGTQLVFEAARFLTCLTNALTSRVFLLITWNQSVFAHWHAISRLLSAPSSWRCSTLPTRDGICLKAPNEQSSLHQAFKT